MTAGAPIIYRLSIWSPRSSGANKCRFHLIERPKGQRICFNRYPAYEVFRSQPSRPLFPYANPLQHLRNWWWIMARGTIRQRSKVRKNSWTVQIPLGRHPETGKPRFHSEAVKGPKALAERRRNELLHQLDTGTLAKPSRLSVAAYLEQWLTDTM